MIGNLQYRYNLDQIELEGTWGMNNDSARERFSYLFLKKHDKISCAIKKDEIEFSSFSDESSLQRDELVVNICSANLFEVVVIPHPNIFRVLLQFLSGEYHGFFMYYDKTIEDRFMLNFFLEEAQVRISGDGSNNLGSFNLIGYLNFYRTKGNLFFIVEEIVMRNDMESEVILLGEFKMSKIYNAFNPNENFRVIKSYQHKKKKSNSDVSNN